jgi:FAD/FMN-containing dehydrogenase
MDLKQEIIKTCPKGSVETDPAILRACLSENPFQPIGAPPQMVVCPADVQELTALIALANEHQLNLTLTSSLPPHQKTGCLAESEHIRIDLSGWNRILHVDRRNRVAMIQPGVTYGQLVSELSRHGMTVPMPLSPRRGKSVLASIMDREPATWPNKQWDISDPLASTELIFGTGDFFRTGAAGGPGTLDQQRSTGGAQKSPLGPSQTDFHRLVQGSQGTMAAVTWITIRTELKPSIHRAWLLGSQNLESLIAYTYEVHRPQLGEHMFIVDCNAAAGLIAAEHGEFENIRQSLPPYLALQTVAGFERLPRERVEYQQVDLERIAGSHGLALAKTHGNVSAQDILDQAFSTQNEKNWPQRLPGRVLNVFFLTTLDKAPQLIRVFKARMKLAGLNPDHLGIYIQPMVQNHFCHVEFLVYGIGKMPTEIEKINKFEQQVVEALADAGAFFSRPYGAANDIAFNQNPTAFEILKKMKAIFDPQHIFNKGKWGL